jgi:predicted flavoprotein YhiN
MTEADWDLVVAGGGAAGLAAALTAARHGRKVLVVERTDQCGKKLAITGGKKGNFTHADAPEIMARQFNTRPSVLLKLMRRFPCPRIITFFETLGIKHLVDADGCIWPCPKSAPRLRDELVSGIQKAGGSIATHAHVTALEPTGLLWQVQTENRESGIGNREESGIGNRESGIDPRFKIRDSTFRARAVLVSTGGKSYPATGSSGDGYLLAERLGHQVRPLYSALASLVTEGKFRDLSGITVGKTRVTMRIGESGIGNLESGIENQSEVRGSRFEIRRSYDRAESEFAETAPFLFAGASITGRAVINLCGFAGKALLEGRPVTAVVDWLPDRNDEDIRAELADQRLRHGRMQINNFITVRSAGRLADLLCDEAQVPRTRRLAEMSRDETSRIIRVLKATEMNIVDTEPLARATVTGGGVALDEIDLETFESRLHPGLYFAGEILDVWGRSGGYNLHFAWASGIAVGEAAGAGSANVEVRSANVRTSDC